MNILPASPIDTTGWADEVRQHEAPDWTGVSPEEVARRGKAWNQDPAQRPWFDFDGANDKVLLRAGPEHLLAVGAKTDTSSPPILSASYCVPLRGEIG
jgi:hypothetical protein